MARQPCTCQIFQQGNLQAFLYNYVVSTVIHFYINCIYDQPATHNEIESVLYS